MCRAVVQDWLHHYALRQGWPVLSGGQGGQLDDWIIAQAGQRFGAFATREDAIRDQLYPRIGFIVTNMTRPPERVSCMPWVSLTLLSMSSTIVVCGRRACTRSIQAPDRSARAQGWPRWSATLFRSGPSGWSMQLADLARCDRPRHASPVHGQEFRHRSHPHRRRGGRTPIGATGQSACAACSCRAGTPTTPRRPDRRGRARRPVPGRPASRRRR